MRIDVLRHLRGPRQVEEGEHVPHGVLRVEAEVLVANQQQSTRELLLQLHCVLTKDIFVCLIFNIFFFLSDLSIVIIKESILSGLIRIAVFMRVISGLS